MGRAPRTKETLPDFREWYWVTRHPRVFRGLTGCQRTPRFWGVTVSRHTPLARLLVHALGRIARTTCRIVAHAQSCRGHGWPYRGPCCTPLRACVTIQFLISRPSLGKGLAHPVSFLHLFFFFFHSSFFSFVPVTVRP